MKLFAWYAINASMMNYSSAFRYKHNKGVINYKIINLVYFHNIAKIILKLI